MHNTIDYSVHSDEAQKRAAAVADVREWFGEERWAKILPDVKGLILSPEPEKTEEDRMSNEDKLRFMMSFGGVQGYPVTALIDAIKAGEL